MSTNSDNPRAPQPDDGSAGQQGECQQYPHLFILQKCTFNPGAGRYVTIQTNWGDWRFEIADADSSPRPGTPGQIVNIAHQLQPRHSPHPPAAQQARDQDQDKREE